MEKPRYVGNIDFDQLCPVNNILSCHILLHKTSSAETVEDGNFLS